MYFSSEVKIAKMNISVCFIFPALKWLFLDRKRNLKTTSEQEQNALEAVKIRMPVGGAAKLYLALQSKWKGTRKLQDGCSYCV
jgi:hypothetical protein